MSDEDKKKVNHAVAWWASVAAFFGSLASFTLLDALNPGEWVKAIAALITAGIVAGGVYSHERLRDAKQERGDIDS